MDKVYAVVLAVVTLAGLAIQQALQILDPAVMVFIAFLKSGRKNKDLPGGMSDADFKKSVMAFVGFVLGVITAAGTHIHTLKHVVADMSDCGDLLITALVISAGTEGANILLKFFGYVKDARKPDPETIVTILPDSASIAKTGTVQFRSRVANGSSNVTWSIAETTTGGAITSAGLYTAPNAAGTYHVVCLSPTDPSRPTFATVTVT